MLTRNRGFSLIELMVTVALGSLLLAAAMPSFTTWITNARIRSVADVLQNGLRTAQVEAQRRASTVVFFKTESKVCSPTDVASSSGQFWQIRTVPNALDSTDLAVPVRCGVLSDVSSGVELRGSTTAVCFNGNGRQTAATNPGAIGTNCTLNTQGTASAFDVVASSTTATETRPMRVLVALGGSVRMCDPNKTLSTTAPDGCPTATP